MLWKACLCYDSLYSLIVFLQQLAHVFEFLGYQLPNPSHIDNPSLIIISFNDHPHHHHPISTPSKHRPSACIYTGAFLSRPQHQRHSIRAERSVEVLRIFILQPPITYSDGVSWSLSPWIFYCTTHAEALRCEHTKRKGQCP